MIKLKNKEDLEKLKVSGKILTSILKVLIKEAIVGQKLSYLDKRAFDLIKESGALPAFLNYQPAGAKKPYPATICTSLNEKIVHGIPDDSILKDGDILKIDLGVNYEGYFTDAAVTLKIGEVGEKVENLIKATKLALERAIELCWPDNYLGDLGYVIEKTAVENNLSVIHNLTGHGVGFQLHEEPTVYNFGQRKTGLKLKPGLVLAIEPMFSLGSGIIKRLKDDSYITKDRSLNAHFEKTVFISENGPIILTPWD